MQSGYLGGAVDRLMVLLMDTLYQLSVLLLSVVLAFLGKVIPQYHRRPLCGVCAAVFPRGARQINQAKSELFVWAVPSVDVGR